MGRRIPRGTGLMARRASCSEIRRVLLRTRGLLSPMKRCWKSRWKPSWRLRADCLLADTQRAGARAPHRTRPHRVRRRMAEWSRAARRIRVPLGFAFAVLYFWLARPNWRSLGIGTVLILPGLLIRALASGHVRKNEALATSGPYAYTRNPLYLGSLLIGIGFALAARNWWIGVVLVVM